MKRVALQLAALALLLGGVGHARAGVLEITGYNGQGVNVNIDGSTSATTLYGGLLQGTYNGTTLHNFYCVESFTDISPGSLYPSTVSLDGKVHGYQVSNASE